MEILPLSRLTTKEKHCVFFQPQQFLRDEDGNLKNSCQGVHLHTVPLCYCYLMSSITLSFGRRWGEYRTPWLNQFNFIRRRYREYLSPYRWVCVAPWQAQGHWMSGTQTLPLSGTVREQTARQRGQISGCYWEAGVILQGCVVEADSPHCWSHFVLSRSFV